MSKQMLPVPVFNDNDLSHSFKQHNSSDVFRRRQRPPKLYPKHYLDTSANQSLTPSNFAHEISFRNHNNNQGTNSQYVGQVLRSPLYRPDHHESYFEQCFEVISRLGEGSFSEVFKVRSRADGELYAIKKSKQPYKSEKYREERLEEVRRYEQLSSHKHCIHLYYAWEQDHHLYMQLELCRENLDSFACKTKQMAESTVWNILTDLLLAIKALHDRNLIHLDVKLENIMITEDNVCKLGDFGLVVDLNNPNLHQSCEGDSRYIAPELMQAHFTKAADIFSFGITALELVCNLDLPNNGPLWVQLRNGTFPTCLELVSPEMQSLVRNSMNPSFAARPNVESLLRIPRIEEIISKRRKFEPIQKLMHVYPRLVVRMFNQTMIFVRQRFVWLAVIIMSIFSLRDHKPTPNTPVRTSIYLHPSTPITNQMVTPNQHQQLLHSHESHLLMLDDSEIESSPRAKSPTIRIANSTPLTANIGAFRKSRRELSMQNLNTPIFLGEPTNNQIHHNSSVCASPKSSFELSSSMCSKRKKLFSDDSDESD